MKLITTGRAAAVALALGLPLAGQAQSPNPTPQPAPAAATQVPAPAANPARRTQHLTQEQMMQQVETHLAQLRTRLAITPAQEPQWQEFAKVQRENAVAMRQRFTERGAQLAQMSAADNMMDYAQITELLARERMRLATTFRALYDSMSPEQKQRADAAFREHPPRQQQRRAGSVARAG